MKTLFLALGAFAIGGCQTISPADTSGPPVVKKELSPGPMNVKTSPFVGSFGEKLSANKGMSVKFSSDGNVTVDGVDTTALGTYTGNDQSVEATFHTTNIPKFSKTTFTLSNGGKELSFVGPRGTIVKLPRTL